MFRFTVRGIKTFAEKKTYPPLKLDNYKPFSWIRRSPGAIISPMKPTIPDWIKAPVISIETQHSIRKGEPFEFSMDYLLEDVIDGLSTAEKIKMVYEKAIKKGLIEEALEVNVGNTLVVIDALKRMPVTVTLARTKKLINYDGTILTKLGKAEAGPELAGTILGYNWLKDKHYFEVEVPAAKTQVKVFSNVKVFKSAFIPE